MSNKTRLSNNNIDLQELISSANNLPYYENLTEEIQAQPLVVEEIMSILQTKSGINGEHVWKKLTEENGEFLNYIISTDESAYPDNGIHTDGYYYIKYDSSTNIPENIKEGINIFGVTGSMKEGTAYGIFFNEIDSDGYPTDITITFNDIPANLFAGLKKFVNSSYVDTNIDMFKKVTKITINANTINELAFSYINYYFNTAAKIKINATTIGTKAFARNDTDNKYWISSKCTTIIASDINATPFFVPSANGQVKFYCEADSAPSGWGPYWYYTYYDGESVATGNVTYGVSEEEFDAL